MCTGADGQPVPSRYDLIANVVHEGKAGQQTSGAPYRVHVHRAVEKAWYEVQVCIGGRGADNWILSPLGSICHNGVGLGTFVAEPAVTGAVTFVWEL